MTQHVAPTGAFLIFDADPVVTQDLTDAIAVRAPMALVVAGAQADQSLGTSPVTAIIVAGRSPKSLERATLAASLGGRVVVLLDDPEDANGLDPDWIVAIRPFVSDDVVGLILGDAA